LRAERIATIPNGYDESDFAGAPPAAREEFAIVHTGYLHTQLGRSHRRGHGLRQLLGGAADVDILTRSHLYLLQAIDVLRTRQPELAARIRVHLVGLASEADRAAAAGSAVEIHGYVSHDEAVAWLRSASLLFLPMQNLPAGVRATIVPGKTYEYLAAGRPILAAVPDGDARDLLAAAGNAYLCRPDDADAMAAAIATEVERWAGASLPSEPAAELVARFERRQLTRELAGVFDRVLAAS
jgi:glycosyltransferase involved in cell wall biosynthesis